MKYKLDENGNIVKGENGHPVVISDDNKESTIDAIGAAAHITTLNKENKDFRKAASKANGEVETLTATNAELQGTVDSLGEDNKVEMDAYKTTINKAWEKKEETWNTEKEGLNGKLFQATTGSKFATSKTIKATILPPDIAKDTFGKHFNPDGTANDSKGNLIYSKERPGEAANFEESMEHIINEYPGKNDILRSSGAHGSGDHGDDGSHQTNLSARDNIKAGIQARR